MHDKVKAPAIALIVVAVIGILTSLAGFFLPALQEALLPQMDLPPEQAEEMRRSIEAMRSSTAMLLAFNALAVAVSVFVVFAALRMMRLESWSLAVVASILVMVPCLGCCCVGIPVGVWALIVLMKPDVRAAFEIPAPPPM